MPERRRFPTEYSHFSYSIRNSVSRATQIWGTVRKSMLHCAQTHLLIFLCEAIQLFAFQWLLYTLETLQKQLLFTFCSADRLSLLVFGSLLKMDLNPANSFKQKGNDAFKLGNLEEALKCYTEAVEILGPDGYNKTAAIILSKRAQLHLKMER